MWTMLLPFIVGKTEAQSKSLSQNLSQKKKKRLHQTHKFLCPLPPRVYISTLLSLFPRPIAWFPECAGE